MSQPDLLDRAPRGAARRARRAARARPPPRRGRGAPAAGRQAAHLAARARRRRAGRAPRSSRPPSCCPATRRQAAGRALGRARRPDAAGADGRRPAPRAAPPHPAHGRSDRAVTGPRPEHAARPALLGLARAAPPEPAGRLDATNAGARDRALARRLPDDGRTSTRSDDGLRRASFSAFPHARPGGGHAALARSGRSSARTSRSQDLQAQVDATHRKIAPAPGRGSRTGRRQPATEDDAAARRRAHGPDRDGSSRGRRDTIRTAQLRDRVGSQMTTRRPRRPSRARATGRCTTSASPSAGSGSAPSTCSRSPRPSSCSAPLVWLVARAVRRRREDAAARAGLDLSEDAERRLADRQLAELRVDAAGVLDRATRRSPRPRSCTSAAARARPGSRRTRPERRSAARQHVEVDLDRRRPSACSRRRCAPTPRRSRRTGSSSRGTRRGRRPCRSAPRSGGTPSRPGDGAGAPARFVPAA